MPFSPAVAAAWIASLVAPAPGNTGADDLIANLGSDDWAVRQAADDALRALEPPGLAPLEPFLSRADLGPEQRVRLRSIAIERFSLEPHAAMGIQWGGPARQFDDFDGTPARIGGTVPGFDAASKLKAGDVITAMDGRPVGSRQELRAAIISHTPGDVTTLSIMRGPLRLEAQVILGSFADLNQTDRPDSPTLAQAFDFRLARAAGARLDDPARPLDGLSLIQWNRADAGVIHRGGVSFIAGEDEIGGLLVGGEARGLMPGPTARANSDQLRMRIAPAASPSTGRPPGLPRNQVRPTAPNPAKPQTGQPGPRPAPRPGA